MTSTCSAVSVAAFHEGSAAAGARPFLANQRLALVRNGRVPCLDIESGQAAECPFEAGNWLEDDKGNRYAQVGQAVSTAGAATGDHVIAARVENDTVACVGASGHDTAGRVAPSSELNATCVQEEMNQAWNASSVLGAAPLINYATIAVCSANNPDANRHPDNAMLVGEDRSAQVYCYAGAGAGLNDLNGTERDATGLYVPGTQHCHTLVNGGLEVPAAKRPATRSLPAPGVVKTDSLIVWRPVNPNVSIANGEGQQLSITQQPTNLTVPEGQGVSFRVIASGNKLTLAYQWQRNGADIAGANADTYTLPATTLADSGATFRVLVTSWSGSVTSAAATLTVTARGTVALSLLPIVGLRDQAMISQMTGIAQDPAGSFSFITGHRIKRLSADLDTITPVAGGSLPGAADGAAAVAAFNQPLGLTHDAAGNLYVADTGNHTIRRIAADGSVSTLAGLAGSSGATDGAGRAARFARPSGIAIGPDGDLYVSELDNHVIRRVSTAGVVTTYAGSAAGYAEGLPLSAKFNSPFAVAVAANGDVLVADTSNNRIRRIVRHGDAAASVQTLAGNGSATAPSPDGVGAAAVIANPRAMVVRGNTLSVRDSSGLLRQIDLANAAVTTLAGSRSLGEGYADGTSTTARLRGFGTGLSGAPQGGFMLADDLALRLVSAGGAVRTIAAAAAVGATPQGVGTLAQMPFGLAVNDPQAVAVDPAGNVVIADGTSRLVRRISPAGIVTLAAGLTGGFHGAVDGVGSEAQLANLGVSIASDGAGILSVADGFSVRRIARDNATTLLAGSSTDFGAVDGDAGTARFNRPMGLAVGPGAKVFVGDGANNAVRRIDAAGNVGTYAGVMGQSRREDGAIAAARFRFPGQLAYAPDGALYVVERQDGVIRRVAPDGASVTTLPVPAVGGLTGSIAVDAAGTLYYGSTSGLVMLRPGDSPTVLIPPGNAVVLGGSPRLPAVDALAVLGPKQLVILSGGQVLKATLP